MARTRRSHPILSIVLLTALCGLAQLATAAAQQIECPRCLDDDFGYRLHHHYERAAPVPERVGQAALGAIQEVVGLLLSDPSTDWSTVSIARLRQHLVDLDEILLNAEVEEQPIDGGLSIHLRGSARTLEAVRHVIPGHVRRMDGFRGWSATFEDTDDGLDLTLTTADPDEVAILRGLGFFGFVATGVHRPHELLAVARDRAGAQP